MSYWAAYHGQGLCLSEKEFKKLLKNYKASVTDKAHLRQIKKVKDGDMDISEVTFTTPEGKTFSMFCADDGCCEGFRLTPYRVNGKPNKKWDHNLDIPSENVYVLSADRSIDGMDCFEKKAYDSYEAFVNEFKEKVAWLLPENFDWDAHIGIYSFACYA